MSPAQSPGVPVGTTPGSFEQCHRQREFLPGDPFRGCSNGYARTLCDDVMPAAKLGKPLGTTIVNVAACETCAEFPVQVVMKLEILRDLDIKEMEGEITIDAFLTTTWRDHRLRLNDHVYNTTNLAFVSPLQSDELWKPDIVFVPMKELVVMKGMKLVRRTVLHQNKTLVYKIGCSIKLLCSMDFSMYPMDIHKCEWRIYSWRHNYRLMNLTWDNPPMVHRTETGFTNMKLPQYRMKFLTTEDEDTKPLSPKKLFLTVILQRDIKSIVLVTFFPSALFVIVSWGSFLVIPEVVPGRMVLLVTTLLTLVTMLNSVRQTTPESEGIKPIEIWVIACIAFVFLALFEYCVVLYGIRYETTWRLKKRLDGEVIVTNDNREENFDRRRSRRFPFIFRTRKREFYRQGRLDLYSLFVFPIFFLIFNIYYWSMYAKLS